MDERSDTDHNRENVNGTNYGVDRRVMLGGMTAVASLSLTPSQPRAEGTSPSLTIHHIRAGNRHHVTGVALDYETYAGSPQKLSCAFFSEDFVDRASFPKIKIGDKTKNPPENDVSITFERIKMSNDAQHDYKLAITFTPGEKSYYVSATLQAINGGQVIASTKTPNLTLEDWLTAKSGLSFDVPHAEAVRFVARLFGERVVVEKSSPITLALYVDNVENDTIRTVFRPLKRPFFVLGSLKNTAPAFRSFKDMIAFSGMTVQRVGKDSGEGSSHQKDDPQAEQFAWLGQVHAEGLKVQSQSDVIRDGRKTFPYTIGGDGSKVAISAEISFTEQPHYVIFRQWGNSVQTLALVRAPMRLALRRKEPAGSPSEFIIRDAVLEILKRNSGKIVKDPKKSSSTEVLVETLRGHLSDKPFRIDTAYGAMVVAGDPVRRRPAPAKLPAEKPPAAGEAKPPAPQKPYLPPTQLREEEPRVPVKGLTHLVLSADDDDIIAFDARALLSNMAVLVPNDMRAPDGDLSGPPMPHYAADVWSRLDFDGTEIAFRLPLPRLTQNPQVWPSARGVVTLCEPPRSYGSQLAVPAGDVQAVSQTGKKHAAQQDVPAFAPVVIALDGARLRLRRQRDNLALDFRFARMALELGKGQSRIVPNMRLGGMGAGQAKSKDAPPHYDDRPLLIVEFPPQHVVEEAYFRQVNDGVSLPAAPMEFTKQNKSFQKKLRYWRDTNDKKTRDELFKENEKLASTGTDENLKDRFADYLAFSTLVKTDVQTDVQTEKKPRGWYDLYKEYRPTEAEALLARWKALPEQQRNTYLGDSALALDPDARTVFLAIRRAQLAASTKEPDDALNAMLGLLPVAPEIPAKVAQMLADDAKAAVTPSPLPDSEADAARVAQERRRLTNLYLSKMSPEFAQISTVWTKAWETPAPAPAGALTFTTPPANQPDPQLQAIARYYLGPDDLRRLRDTMPNDRKTSFEDIIKRFATHVASLFDGMEPFKEVSRARLAGCSRLVFRFDTAGGDQFEQGNNASRDLSEASEWAREIEFSVTGLTDWGRYDLAVTRRAETLESQPGGRIPHASLRGVESDAASILAFQGIRKGEMIADRMADIMASLRPPTALETSIEIPARLYLSPDQFARFRTPRPVDPRVLLKPGDCPSTRPQWRVDDSLWSADLQTTPIIPIVRAVWSDDFDPQALQGKLPPDHTLDAPWERIDDGSRTPFRMPTDARDRHEFVVLTSVYGLPAMGRRDASDQLVDTSQFEPPEAYRLRGFRPESSDGKRDLTGIYNPSPLSISQLKLSAFGATLRHDSAFVPPVAPFMKGNNTNRLYSALAVERWQQFTVLGRDISVEVVYKGFLFPLGVRASLVKLTERRFMRNPQAKNGYTAFLIQRNFIRIGKPTKTFPAVGQADRSRRFKVSDLTMLTLETPDLCDYRGGVTMVKAQPLLNADGKHLQHRLSAKAHGQLIFETGAGADNGPSRKLQGAVFWPRTRAGAGGDVLFEFKIDNQLQPMRMPLIFVDNEAANQPEMMAALAAYYNFGNLATHLIGDAQRKVSLGWARRRYVDEYNDGDSQHETDWWLFGVEGRSGPAYDLPAQVTGAPASPPFAVRKKDDPNRNFDFDPLLQGSDQPPFYPFVRQARVRLGPAERFIGTVLPPQIIGYADSYRMEGFRSDAEFAKPQKANETWRFRAYAELLTPKGDDATLPIGMGANGDRSGAIGRFAGNVHYLCMPPAYVAPVNMGDAIAAAPPQPIAEADPPTIPETSGTEGAEKAIEVFKNIEHFVCDMSKYLSDGFKILGLISGDEAFGEVGNRVSELREKVETASTEVLVFIRSHVLPPLREAIDKLDEMWNRARASLSNATTAGGRPDLALDINDVYPDLAPALAKLRAKLSIAETADFAHFMVAITELHGAARHFVTIIAHIASDPVTPFKESLKEKFNLLSADITKFVAMLGGDFRQAVEALKDNAKKQLSQTFIDAINGDTLRPVRSLLIQFPAVSQTMAPPMADEMASLIDNAIKSGLKTMVTEVIQGAKWESATNKALSTAMDTLERQKDSVSLLTKNEYNKYLITLDKKIKALVDSSFNYESAQKAILSGPIFDSLRHSTAFRQIDQELRTMQGILSHPGKDVLVQLSGSAQRMLDALQRDMIVLTKEYVSEKISESCKTIFEYIKIHSKTMLWNEIEIRNIIDTLNKKIDDYNSTSVSGFTIAKIDRNLAKEYSDLIASSQNLLATIEADYCNNNALEVKAATVPTTATRLLKEADTIKTTLLHYASRVIELQISTFEHDVNLIFQSEGKEFIESIKKILNFIKSYSGTTTSELEKIISKIKEINNNSSLSATNYGSIRDYTKTLLSAAERYRDASVEVSTIAGKALDDLNAISATTTIAGLKTAKTLLSQDPQAKAPSAMVKLSAAQHEFLAFVHSATLTPKAIKEALLKPVFALLAPVFEGIDKHIYARFIEVRNAQDRAFQDEIKNNGIIKKILTYITFDNKIESSDLFYINPVTENGAKQDDIVKEKNYVLKLYSTTPESTIDEKIKALSALGEVYGRGKPAIVLLVDRLSLIITTILRGEFAKFIDLRAVRREVENTIAKILPTRISRSFDMPLKLKNIGNLAFFTSGDGAPSEFVPRPHPKGKPNSLTISAVGEIDLFNPSNSSFHAEAYLCSAAVNILPGFLEVVTLFLAPSSFSTGQGQPLHCDVKVESFKLGPAAEFLEQIAQLMPGRGKDANKDESGFRLNISMAPPGVEVSYGLPTTSVSIGPMLIDNISLSVAALLPFSDSDAQFTISISRPEAPFSIIVPPYAGSGHLAMIANAREIIGFEASFQYGGGAGFTYGPLVGKGRIQVGIMVRCIRGYTELYGLFYAGGAASIGCFGMTAELFVKLTHKDGNMEGSARFTFSFSVFGGKISYTITVYKKESGGNKSAQKVGDLHHGTHTMYAGEMGNVVDLAASEFRDVTSGAFHTISSLPKRPILSNRTVCKGRNYQIYRKYFAETASSQYENSIGAPWVMP